MSDEKGPLDAPEAMDRSDQVALQQALYKAMLTVDQPGALLAYLQELARNEAREALEATDDSAEARKWIELAEAFGAGIEHMSVKPTSRPGTLAGSASVQEEGRAPPGQESTTKGKGPR
jgi:hypothetical protein